MVAETGVDSLDGGGTMAGMQDIIARINKCVEDAETAGWEDVGFPANLLIECRDEIATLRSPWISVNDDTPDSDQSVLVWNSGGYCLKPWAWYQICCYRDGKWREQDEADEYPGVTHWMPLPPEPPNWKPLFEPPSD
jgi:hypothetical protein